jgi:hypothetical protein
LFEFVKDGGTYVVDDIVYGGLFNHQDKIRAICGDSPFFFAGPQNNPLIITKRSTQDTHLHDIEQTPVSNGDIPAHNLQVGRQQVMSPSLPAQSSLRTQPLDFLAQISANTAVGPNYEGDSAGVLAAQDPPVRLIAFYLPQFHPISENDIAWGKGFTEWTNVSKALPRFVGHYQPRLPGELGFYDLRLTDTLRQQSDLARRYGIHGFCFHYYWLNGKRLLSTPLDLLLAHPDIDVPFCVSWANHNWTRNWDGGNGEILQEQRYSPEDDLAFVRSLEPLMRDKRYIRIDGRPILLVYKPKLLPDAVATVKLWRRYLAKGVGLGEPYIVMCHIDEYVDPTVFEMDAAVGFPPNPFGWWLPNISASVVKLDPQFSGIIRSYEMMASQACALPRREYTFFHGVCPGWDCEARQPGRGASFIGSCPGAYSAWLARACRRTLDERVGDQRLVFINAWNEWGEGAYLEPDRHYGYAYLAATARVLNSLKTSKLENGSDRAVATEINRVYTIHGSVLFVDEASLELRHGHVVTSPANAFFVSEQGFGRFVHIMNGIRRDIITFFTDRGYAGGAEKDGGSAATSAFEKVHINTELVGLKAREQFLSAEPNGQILLNRMHCREWEHFRVLPFLGKFRSVAPSVADR